MQQITVRWMISFVGWTNVARIEERLLQADIMIGKYVFHEWHPFPNKSIHV